MNRIELLNTHLKENPNDPFLHFAMAKEHEKIGNTDLALKSYLHLTENFPDYIGTYFHLGKLYEELDQSEMALTTYDNGIAKGKKVNDWHAISELQGAKTNLELEL